MTLEDFFTLTEMKNGLMALARVEELVSIMQKESNCVVRNFAEASRQWSAVASALAATESEDSLDLFIKLDGLQFLNQWLQEAQKCCDKTNDCSVEELVTVLLGALEKLPIDQECSISSGITATVRGLFDHKSSRVQDRARALVGGWNQVRDTDSCNLNIGKGGSFCNNEVADSPKATVESRSPEHSAVDISSFGENHGAENHVDSAGDETSQSRSLDVLKPGTVEGVQIITAHNFDACCDTLITADMENRSHQDAQEEVSAEKNSSIPLAEGTVSIDAHSFPVPVEGDPVPPRLDLSQHGDISGKVENLESSSCRMEDTTSVNDASKLVVEVGKVNDSIGTADVSSLEINTKDSSKVDGFDSELKYGVVDAVEVAHQVGKSKQDAGDDIEPFCSSAEENYQKIEKPCSPDSVNGKVIHGLKTIGYVSGEASARKEVDHLTSSNNLDTKFEDCIQDTILSQVTENAQLASNSGKDMLAFDLNEGVCPEEMDCPDTPISAIVSSVVASRPDSVEGALGFKGSTVTCAFHPAHTQRTPDGYQTGSVEGSSYSSKQRQDLIGIDLNAAVGDVDGAVDTVLTDQIPASSCLVSGESSIEVSSKTAEKNIIDLNLVFENDDAPSFHKREEKSFYCHLDGHNNPSPAASSSSRQALLSNIDLNENLSLSKDMHDQPTDPGHSSSQGMNSFGEFKQDDSVIWIMGKRVEVDRKDIAPSQSILPPGHAGISILGTNIARHHGIVGVQHAMAYPATLDGYNGFAMGPSMSPSVVHAHAAGSIPCMVDSRGAPVVAQIIGAGMALPSPYPQEPFLVGVNPATLNTNGFGPTRAGIDLNSSFMMEANRSELGSWRPGQSKLEECMWSSSQYLSSGSGVKRKEPVDGWDSYPGSYKQKQLLR